MNRFKYEFKDLEVAKKLATNLSVELSGNGLLTIKEALLLLLASLHSVDYGGWNEYAGNMNDEIWERPDMYQMSKAVSTFLYQIGLSDTDLTTWEALKDAGEAWVFDDNEEYFNKYFSVGDYANLEWEYNIYGENGINWKYLTEENLEKVKKEEDEEFEEMTEVDKWYDMFPDGYVGDGVTVDDMIEAGLLSFEKEEE